MEGSPHPRHYAIAATEAMIVDAELLREAQRLALQGLVAAGHNAGRAAALLRLTDERIELLRASRLHLMDGAPAEAAEDEPG